MIKSACFLLVVFVAVRVMADLSLTDALTDSVPQPDVENMVQRDFVAALEAETFDDQVGETVDKTNYIPLLDNDGKGESDLWC